MGEQISNGCSALDWDKEGEDSTAASGRKEGRGSTELVVHSVAIFNLLSKFFIILNFKNRSFKLI